MVGVLTGKPRDPERIKPLMKKLRKYWDKHPDLRFFQLIAHVQNTAMQRYHSDPFFYEDHWFEATLDKLLEE